ncbi:uncharacterized protein BXZ73DRAFT_106331 [Epithele typhae]|uniref:uncharacterized protein n=1 Tax=Epithele typhae TaxID=378194 RepID=UPI0020074865|nr:uncharacterized protein BXZ73DRAFT_106331 [Epithele typhae]KAH9915020.1 hypothetical protein BXZ73DRAFT_106331 [Epithele typhae]
MFLQLNNKYGHSPCTLQDQLNQACSDDPDDDTCTCNTMMYNVGAACQACSGNATSTWSQWASAHSCGSTPGPPPSHLQVQKDTVPDWAYQNLSSSSDFNLAAALAQSPPNQGLSKGAEVAVIISVAMGALLLSSLGFWWYWRRKWARQRNSRQKTLPLLPGQNSPFHPAKWLRWVGLFRGSQRLRPTKKNSEWEIDDDDDDDDDGTELLSQSSGKRNSYHSPYSALSPQRAYGHNVSPSTSGHVQSPSGSSLLSRLPSVRLPSFLERFSKFKDGVPKSTSYKSKYVSPSSADVNFQIDGPIPESGELLGRKGTTRTVADFRPRLSGSLPGDNNAHRLSRPVTDPGAARPDHMDEGFVLVPEPAPVPESVLIISKDGRDFSLDDTTTVAGMSGGSSALSHPPSAFGGRLTTSSGSGSFSRTGTASMIVSPVSAWQSSTGSSSWLPSRSHRAETSSTVSGAYPHELRRDPDLAAPPSWANKFPLPPTIVPPVPPLPPLPDLPPVAPLAVRPRPLPRMPVEDLEPPRVLPEDRERESPTAMTPADIGARTFR